MKTITQFKSIYSFSTKRLFAEKVTENDLEIFRQMHMNETVMQSKRSTNPIF